MRFGTTFLVSLGLSMTLVGCGGGAKGPVAGQEGGPCKGNGMCDSGLTCASNLCVRIGGGGTGGGAGTMGAAGTAGSGRGGTTGGAGAGGTTGTGGAGAGGNGGRGGSGGGSCTNTSSDPNNCGSCGHVCESGRCTGGECMPYPGACFQQSAGFTTCDAFCSSVGEVCVFSGCLGGVTVLSWPSEEIQLCETLPTSADEARQAPCDLVLQFDPGRADYRCCCTDTH